jgi:pimeloyl-ACP methyl ester carboxylesterase
MGNVRRFGSALVAVLAGVSLGVGAAPAASAAAIVTEGCLESVPDPGTSTPVSICYTLYQPPNTGADNQVPVIFEGHGWGGNRQTDPSAFSSLIDAGFGVLSFDQRGFGDSGGKAHLMRPEVEGKDVQRLIDFVAEQPWVAKDAPGDPVLGAMGGSYGGGYQFVGAMSEIMEKSATRFDALAPEITWHSLSESLAPQGVARTEWALLLYLGGLPSDAHTTTVTKALLEALVTGNIPVSLEKFLERNGPAFHVAEGRKLDIPVLMRQGLTDNLFPMDQAIKTYDKLLTPEARERSVLIGHNGGHVLPSVIPPGTNDALASLAGGTVESDPCSKELGGTFGELRLKFFQRELQGKDVDIPGEGQYHLATADGRCQTVSSVQANTTVELGKTANLVGVGAPIAVPIKSGPLTVAGTPTLDAKVTSLALDGRMFVSLAVGTSPLNAKIVQNNMLPIREPGIVVDKPRKDIELPSVAVDVPAGKTLYLLVTPISDMSFGHGSRVPGAMILKDMKIHLPLVG